MRYRDISKWLLVATAVVWAAYDFLPFFDPSKGDTISEVIAYYAVRVSFIPYAFGVLCGHFFWTRDGRHPRPQFLIPISASVTMLDVVAHVFGVEFLRLLQEYPMAFFAFGIPIGTMFWPQQRGDKLAKYTD